MIEQQNDKRLLDNQLKIPDIKFPEFNQKTNYQVEIKKLIQANTLMTSLIKDSLMQKYGLQQKVQNLSDYIKKMETQNKEGKFPFK